MSCPICGSDNVRIEVYETEPVMSCCDCGHQEMVDGAGLARDFAGIAGMVDIPRTFIRNQNNEVVETTHYQPVSEIVKDFDPRYVPSSNVTEDGEFGGYYNA